MNFGVEVKLRLVLGNKMIERGVEHPDYLRTLVVHDGGLLLVPQDGYSETNAHGLMSLTWSSGVQLTLTGQSSQVQP